MDMDPHDEINELIIRAFRDRGGFDYMDHKYSGMAHLAMQKGFNTLTVGQKNLFRNILSQSCCGYTDPHGHHECDKVLEGLELLEALTQTANVQIVQCDECRENSLLINQQDQLIKE